MDEQWDKWIHSSHWDRVEGYWSCLPLQHYICLKLGCKEKSTNHLEYQVFLTFCCRFCQLLVFNFRLQTQHTCYAATARLLKRWAGVHLLSAFLPEPVTDLIAASLFIHPTPFQLPRYCKGSDLWLWVFSAEISDCFSIDR